MADIEQKLSDVLSETRLVVLGTQLLLGLQYDAVFATGFEALPQAVKWLDLVALALMLFSIAPLIATPAFHRIAEDGAATPAMLRYGSRNLEWALLPLGLALAIDIVIATRQLAGFWGGVTLGTLFFGAALIAWHGHPLAVARRRNPPEVPDMSKPPSPEQQVDQSLTELRLILPGVQALFGFQFAAVLTESFTHLPATSQAIHTASLGVVAVAVILLMAPAAYHRIAARGEDIEAVPRYAARMMLAAMGCLALGFAGDFYVTIRKVSDMPMLSAFLSLGALAGFLTLWYGVPILARRQGVKPGKHARA